MQASPLLQFFSPSVLAYRPDTAKKTTYRQKSLMCKLDLKETMLQKLLLPTLLLALSPALFAAPPPVGGGQLQQIPPAPRAPGAAPGFEVRPAPPRSGLPLDAQTQRITVNSLRVTGAAAFSEAELLAQTGFRPATELSLDELRGMAGYITTYYRSRGYFVAQVYLPQQDIRNGMVTIAVMEGQYGQVKLDNQTNVSGNLANGLLDGLKPGDPVTSAALENRLLLLSDLPGVKVNSTLMPGAAPGSSDLLVTLTPGARVSGSVDADNAGNRYTGANRVGATVNFNEPLGLGDVASLRALSSGEGLNYLRGSYQMQFGKATAGVTYSAMRYELGKEFASLQAHGTAEVASVFASYPLIRTRQSNLYAALVYEAKSFKDQIDTTASTTDKKAQVATASLSGDYRDGMGGGGTSTYSLAWSVGNIDLQTPAMHLLDAQTTRTDGHFHKLSFAASRLQRITDSLSLSAAISGQLASKNLDVSEKMELGGMYGVRAYPEGEAYADQGYLLNLEARWQVPKFSEALPGQLQLIAFIDAGRVSLYKNPQGTESNHRTLSGAGLGLNWYVFNNFMVRAYYAGKLGDETATSAPDESGRFWIQAVKYF